MNKKQFGGLAWSLGLGYLTSSMALAQSNYEPYNFTTIAGQANSSGSTDGTGSEARFGRDQGAFDHTAVDGAGNVYVADAGNHTIRKLTPVGTNWVVTTLAGQAGSLGSGDGSGSDARFYRPQGVAVDGAGNLIVADERNHTIRKLTPVGTNWVVTTLAGQAGSPGSADGSGSDARFRRPQAVVVDNAGNIYVADTNNNTVRKLRPVGTDWEVTTLAGQAGTYGSADGIGSEARFGTKSALSGPGGVALDSAGNIYVADWGNHTIRKLTPIGTKWAVTTLAGQPGIFGSADGTGREAQFYFPNDVALDRAGNVYVADQGNDTIRKLTPIGTNWVVRTLAGQAGSLGSADGSGIAALFSHPATISIDSAGNLYVADASGTTIRKGTPTRSEARIAPPNSQPQGYSMAEWMKRYVAWQVLGQPAPQVFEKVLFPVVGGTTTGSGTLADPTTFTGQGDMTIKAGTALVTPLLFWNPEIYQDGSSDPAVPDAWWGAYCALVQDLVLDGQTLVTKENVNQYYVPTQEYNPPVRYAQPSSYGSVATKAVSGWIVFCPPMAVGFHQLSWASAVMLPSTNGLYPEIGQILRFTYRITVEANQPLLTIASGPAVQLAGDPNTSYVIESSSDLKTWRARSDLAVTTSNDGKATVPIAGGAPRGLTDNFFRARVP